MDVVTWPSAVNNNSYDDRLLLITLSILNGGGTDGTAPAGPFFTAQRYAKRVICMPSSCVCLCVCVSVTLRYCITSGSAMAEGPRDSLSVEIL